MGFSASGYFFSLSYLQKQVGRHIQDLGDPHTGSPDEEGRGGRRLRQDAGNQNPAGADAGLAFPI